MLNPAKNFFSSQFEKFNMPGKLTVYRAGGTLARAYVKRTGYGRAINTGIALGKFAYKNRKSIAKGAKYLRSKRRKKSVSSRVIPASNPTGVESKQDTSPQVATDAFIENLYAVRVVMPAQGTAYTQRLAPNIWISGIKICRTFYYDQLVGTGGDIGPLKLHWGLVQMKSTPGNANTDAVNKAVMALQFFRSNDETTDRHRAFVDATAAPKTWDDYTNCLPMNPDGAVKILTRRKKWICARDTQSQTMGKERWQIEKYYKIKKNLHYYTSTSTTLENPIYEVFWYNTYNPATYPAASPTTVAYVKTYKTNTVYFREQK